MAASKTKSARGRESAGLVRGVYSLTHTKRRRFLWCAWWTAEPCAKPFRAPDAWGAGERTAEEAKAKAEAAAGMPLELIEGRWAGAWVRVREGRDPFVSRAPKTIETETQKPRTPYDVIGVPITATLLQVKAAFRKKATEHHPDKGGDPNAFIALMRAYETIIDRRSRPRRRR